MQSIESRTPGRAARAWITAAGVLTSSCAAPGSVTSGAEPTKATATADDPLKTTRGPKRVLLAMTSHDKKGDTGQPTGAYLSEIAHPYNVFAAAGYEIDFASVRGGKVPLDGVEGADAESLAFLNDARLKARLETSLASSKVDPSRYDAILFAGGHGAMWDLPHDEAFASVTRRIYEAGGVVSAVCHGPAALVDVKLSNGSWLVADKQVSGFTNDEERAAKADKIVPFLLEDRLVERGGRFAGATMWVKQVSVQDRLVTGQNPASARGVAEAVVGLLAR